MRPEKTVKMELMDRKDRTVLRVLSERQVQPVSPDLVAKEDPKEQKDLKDCQESKVKRGPLARLENPVTMDCPDLRETKVLLETRVPLDTLDQPDHKGKPVL